MYDAPPINRNSNFVPHSCRLKLVREPHWIKGVWLIYFKVYPIDCNCTAAILAIVHQSVVPDNLHPGHGSGIEKSQYKLVRCKEKIYYYKKYIHSTHLLRFHVV
jgi:hypothetical protein